MVDTRLSKSRYLSGAQCALKLWFDVHRRDLRPEPDAALATLLEQGSRVGELARERWPGGVLVGAAPWEREAAIDETAALMADPAVPALFEAAFEHEDVLARVDVLVREPSGGWTLAEVKRSTRTKDVFVADVAVQAWILGGAGVPVERAGLLLLNRDYVHGGGALDLAALFRFEMLDDAVDALRGSVGETVETLTAVLAADAAPDIEVGDHCFSPYPCPYYAHCSRDLPPPPEHGIELLPRLSAAARESLAAAGVDTLEDIPDDFALTPTQQRVRECIVSGEPWVSDGLAEALDAVAWPASFLDFEAYGQDIPVLAGMRPFDALPFQFSCHRQAYPDAELEHVEFLADTNDDPRRALALALLDAVGDAGSIVVYSSYEKRTINALAGWLPDLAERLEALVPRLFDLLAVVREHYCHPAFLGSYSIKKVLPVLAPDLDYADLEVADGEAAGRAWNEFLDATEPARREALRTALLAYCRQDSLAMVRVHERLKAIAGDEG